ncbi:MAG: S8 family serine peptidase [Porticoccaceae bacterium]|nr:S8 family serine peptidase [Porticoccaceae bacterium]
MKNPVRYFSAIVTLCASTSAAAQLLQNTAGGALETVDQTLQRTLPQPLPEIERQVLKKPLAASRERLSRLPQTLPILNVHGDTAFVEVTTDTGFRAVAREWLIAIDSGDREKLRHKAVDIIEEKDYPALALKTLRIRVPATWDNADTLRRRLDLDENAMIDRNHIYSPQAQADAAVTPEIEILASAVCDSPLRLGMIDTAINDQHPALKDRPIISRSFLNSDLHPASAHGTAVAGLLVGADPGLSPLIPNATLYAAAIFYGRDAYSQGATLDAMLAALQWLAEQQVPVINMSLAGPPNALLKRAISALSEQQIQIVAAVGNEGPAAPPLYPAAYDEVVAVTAVDGANKIYRWANRGEHVDFAARGVALKTARGKQDVGLESGTSMAAALVSARLTCERSRSGSMAETLGILIRNAKDLGEPGHDPVFGHGLLERH